MTTKAQYETVASQLNNLLEEQSTEKLSPRVSVLDTSEHGYGFGKYGIMLNDDAYELVRGQYRIKSIANAFDGTFTAQNDSFYLEPVTSYIYDLAAL